MVFFRESRRGVMGSYTAEGDVEYAASTDFAIRKTVFRIP